MTIVDMHRYIRVRLDEINAMQFGDIQSEEIDMYINNAIIEFVKKRFNKLSNRYQKGFEQSVKRTSDLSSLIKSDSIETLYKGSFGNWEIDYIIKPTDYLFFISAYSLVKKGDITVSNTRTVTNVSESKTVNVNYSQHDDLLSLLDDPFEKTIFESPICTISDTINFYTDDTFIIDSVDLTYLRQPATVENNVSNPANNVDCDLNSQTHDEIVQFTVSNIHSDQRNFGAEAQFRNLNDNE